jgi:hypothetical protein
MRKVKLVAVFVLLALLLGVVPGAVTAQELPPLDYGRAAVREGDLIAPYGACRPLAAQASSTTTELSIQVVPPGRAEDDSWPIVRQWTETQRDENGKKVTVTYTLRRNPNPVPESQVTPLATTCTYVKNESLQSAQTIQGITQYLTSYFYRYSWYNGGGTYKAYLIYKTVEYWTRTSTSYTVGENTTNWTSNGWNCSNVYSSNTSTGHLFPNWQTSTRTYDYIYDFTKNWPTKTPGPPLGIGVIKTLETTPAYKNGSSIGTLTTEVRLYSE